MPQTPIPPGVPISPRYGAVGWFEPVIVAREAAEQSAASGDGAPLPPRSSTRHQAISRREVSWVGFAGDVDTPSEDAVAASRPVTASAPSATGSTSDDTVAGQGASRSATGAAGIGPSGPPAVVERPTGAEDAVARRGVAVPLIARLGLRSRWLSSGLSHLLRIAMAAVTMGAVAVFAYQGGERLARLAGPISPAAAPEGDRAPTVLMPATVLAATPPADLLSDPLSGPGERAAYFLDRAQAGDPIAQYNIAALYIRVDGRARNFSSAAAWFREAAAGGNAAAQFNLAVMYERGLGVGQNMAEAIAWYRRGAGQSYAPAQYNLGIAYAEGRGLPRDAAAAAQLYRQAAAQGLIPAMVNVAILYETGEGVARSLPEAYAWYRAAARAGDGDGERRARELFQGFTGSQKGKAVMAAAALADTINQTSANQPAANQPAANQPSAPPPAASPPKAAGVRGPAATLRSGGSAGRAVLQPKSAPAQPSG